ncbi:hypothetical protein HAL09_15540 [Helicobacter ailurogastricus]|uniref:Uncharacterized protein n=1 Tax=Helicobacter ailurogastricus TaxID=1578720 RepID=A0A0K2X540_9HELI|nr:hypothetical protein HAL011_13430 [Helicobacter ailurogastricus]CRF44928.1 hypothetical protein HAL09_15540 [Helicobacter ailurogastricus]
MDFKQNMGSFVSLSILKIFALIFALGLARILQSKSED